MKSLSGRTKKCKVCPNRFVPDRLFQTWCSPDCAVVIAKKVRAKENKAELKQRREAVKTRGDWLKDAQEAFNWWIRERDYGNPCISCGRSTGCKVNAGHYRSVGAQPALRFHPDNCHLQCEHCNSYLSSNAIEYRIRLIAKIGTERVEWLEREHEPAKWTISEIKTIKEGYQVQARQLKKQREST